MRTLFVVAESVVNEHKGEEYDHYLEVEDQPTTQTIQEQANRVRCRIRALWEEQVAAGEKEPVVSVKLHAASPFNAMLINLKTMMKDEESILVSLDYPHAEADETSDPETLEVLERLNKGRK